jgi:hypothetical protein
MVNIFHESTKIPKVVLNIILKRQGERWATVSEDDTQKKLRIRSVWKAERFGF